MAVSSATIDSPLIEKEQYPPPESFRRQVVVRDDRFYEHAEKDHNAFWAERAKEFLLTKRWDTVLGWDPPFAKWFAQRAPRNLIHMKPDRIAE